MKHALIVMLVASSLAAGCSSLSTADAGRNAQATAPAADAIAKRRPQPADQLRASDEAGSVIVQTVEFRTGVSSYTVEKLAKSSGCTGTQGAGLITEPGPLEVYRMKCDNGGTFIARCELRQCQSIR